MRNGVEIDYRAFVDIEKGTVDRRIFSDQEVYEMEIERIFARAWNFMCHESMIPKPGDFFLSFIGEESVIATRDKKGNLQVLLNTCRHRGNAVCRAEQGRATSFLCTYHGWTYDLEGRLVGVPGYKDFYHEALDREQWGLPKAAKVASYKGFVFATMDPDAPDLEEYLGPVGRMAIDLVANRGDTVMVDGVQKNVITCNWKLAVDNLFDFYHPQISHASANMSGFRQSHRVKSAKDVPPAPVQQNTQLDHRVVLGEYGHAIGGPRLPPELLEHQVAYPVDVEESLGQDQTWRMQPGMPEQLGPIAMETRGHPNIFPNLWLASGGSQLSLRLPKGPFKTEIWWFTMLSSNLNERQKELRVRSANHVFGPAGMLEQEDGENWDQSTRATAGPVARRYPLHFAMGKGYGEIRNGEPGEKIAYINTPINEHAQFWTYRAWADWMAAESWNDLKRDATQPPVGGHV